MTTYNTGNPIGSAAVKDLYDNAENLDEFVNSKQHLYYPDRLGVARKTWLGMEEAFQQFLIQAGYVGLGPNGEIQDYAAGLEITERNQVFRYDGELYRAGAALDLPYTTTGDWETEGSLFKAVGDQALRQEIANENDPSLGSGMVGYEPGVSVRDAIKEIESNIDKINSTLDDKLPVSSSEFPSIGDALNSGNSVVFIPSGTHVIEDGIVVAGSNLSEIRGSGDTVLDFSNSTSGLVIEDELEEISVPSSVNPAGFNTITFPSAPDLKEGDVLVIWNPEPYSLNDWRDYYHDGFMARVSKVEENSVIIYGVIPEFNRSSIRCFKISNNNPFKISGLKIIPPKGGIGISIRGRQKVSIDPSIEVLSGGYAGIEIERCFDVSVLFGHSGADVTDSYPLIMSNVQNFKVFGFSSTSIRHSIGLGGTNKNGSVPTRDGVISGCVFENDGVLGVGSADIHGNCADIVYDACIFKTSAHLAGKNNKYIGCTVHARTYARDGVCFYGGELSGGTHEIIDCTLVLNNAIPTAPFGVIHLDGRRLNEPLSLVVRGLTLRSDSSYSGSTASLIRYNVHSTTNKTFSFDISGLFVQPSVWFQRLVFLGVADAAPPQFSPRPIVALEKPKDPQRFVEDITKIGTFPSGNLLEVVY